MLVVDYRRTSAPSSVFFPTWIRATFTSKIATRYTGFVRVMENLESRGIFEFHFPSLENHGM